MYSDEYAEAAHVTIRRTVTSSQLIAPEPASRPPFEACGPVAASVSSEGRLYLWFEMRSCSRGLTASTRALRSTGLPPPEVRTRWETLTTLLRDEVQRFPALPSEEPDVTDAAFCLFVHSQAIRDMQASTKWPVAVAKRLGIANNQR